MDTNTMVSVVVALFDLARMNRPATVERVAGRIGESPAVVRGILTALDQRGLVDASRVRLTLLGLAVASAASQGREVKLKAAA